MRAKPVEVSCVRLPVSEPRLARARSQQKPRRCVSTHAIRRHLIGSVATLGAAGALARPAQAGLVMFPPEELNNNYILLRAGESYSDADGVVSTNPVNKQSRYAQLTSLGKRQVVKRVAPALERMLGTNPAWIWPSINSCSYQTAEILTSVLGLGQSRLVPEYSFLDPRGLGALDGQAMADIRPMLQQGDASSELWRPPRGYDGTPNESAQDVLVRVRQVISITETQYDEETIVFVAPDSTVLTVLQAALLGVDLRDHWALFYECVS